MIGIVLLLSLARGEVPPPVVDGEETADFPAVAAIVAHNGSSDTVLCTGTLIEPGWLLSAAHCAEGADELVGIGFSIAAVFGTALDGAVVQRIGVVSWTGHDQWDPDSFAHDVGLFELSEEADATPMSRAPATSAALEGKRLSFVGWGATASDESGGGIKRLAVLPVVDIDADYLYSIEEGGPNLCFGDSGGPAILQSGSIAAIVGINTLVWQPDGGSECEGGGTGSLRVDTEAAFIDNVLAGGDLEDTWVSHPSAWPPDERGTCNSAGGGGLLALLASLAGLLARWRVVVGAKNHPARRRGSRTTRRPQGADRGRRRRG